MAFIPVANTIQANLRLTYQGEEVENVLHFRTAGTPTLADLAAVAEGVEDWWVTNMAPIVPNAVVYREVYATDQTSQTGATFTASGAAGTTGGVNQTEEPNNVTIAISLRTAFRGRSFRGRIYHIGLGQLQIADNEVIPSVLTQLNAAYSQLLQSANFGGAALAVASRYSNNAPRILGISTEVTDIVIADPVVDSQRRRLPGRGR